MNSTVHNFPLKKFNKIIIKIQIAVAHTFLISFLKATQAPCEHVHPEREKPRSAKHHQGSSEGSKASTPAKAACLAQL